MWWIDLERSSRGLIERLARMSALDREAVELVDICGLTPGEAARELGITRGALRVRLLRTRARLQREGGGDVTL
jgi:RNA polymerase sigma-70 factor (ECF subfamily)